MNDKLKQINGHDLKTVAGILIRAAGICLAILIVWFVWLLIGPEFAYKTYSVWFGITRPEFMLLNLIGLMGFKILCITFFLIPFAAIKLYEKSKQTQSAGVLKI